MNLVSVTPVVSQTSSKTGAFLVFPTPPPTSVVAVVDERVVVVVAGFRYGDGTLVWGERGGEGFVVC